MCAGTSNAIAVSGLSKRFGAVEALVEASFTIRRGELFGFLGPNGAGKTTTINILTGLARPDAGEIRVAGIDCARDPKAAQHLVGVVPDESNLYPELSGFENLCFAAALYGIRKREREERARGLLERFDLAQAAGRRFGSYSRGMKRRLTIAAGIIHRPEILFLDEPTTGIDVTGARAIRSLIAELHRGGTTIFLTTHYIEEAERLCDRIAFIAAGRIMRIDSLANLLQPLQDRHVMQVVLAEPAPRIDERVAAAFPGCICRLEPDGLLRIEAQGPIGAGPLVRLLEREGAEVLEARRVRPSLEDVFVDITGIEAETMRREKEKAGGAA